MEPPSRVRPIACSKCTLHRSFCDLSEEIRVAFDALKATTSVPKGAVIFHEHQRCESVYAVCEGSVKLVTTAADGRCLLLRLVHPGEVLGLPEAVLGNAPFETTAIAAVPSLIAVIPRDRFIRFISSYPQAGVALTVALSEQYKLAQIETKFLAFGETSTVRLARLLLEWAAEHGEPAGEGIRIPLLMTHLELAQAIGTTRETVTRIVGNLTRAGVIERRAEGILVHQLHELVHLALHAAPGGAVANATE